MWKLFYCIASPGLWLDGWFYVLDSSRGRHRPFFFPFSSFGVESLTCSMRFEQSLSIFLPACSFAAASLPSALLSALHAGHSTPDPSPVLFAYFISENKTNFSAFCSISYTPESFVFTCNLCSFQEFLLLVVCRDALGSIVCHQSLAQGRGFPPFPSQYCPASCKALLLTLLQLPWQRRLAPGTLLLPRWQLLSPRQALMTIAWPQILY